MADTGSNRAAALDEIAFRARRAWRKSSDDYMAAAQALLEARELCEHGEWLPWLDKTGIAPRTASRMLQIARAGIEIGHVADFGPARVAELLASAERSIAEGVDPNQAIIYADMAESSMALYDALYAGARDRGDTETANRMIRTRPSGPFSARVWLEWAEGPRDGWENAEAVRAHMAKAPWLPGNLAAGLDELVRDVEAAA